MKTLQKGYEEKNSVLHNEIILSSKTGNPAQTQSRFHSSLLVKETIDILKASQCLHICSLPK